MTPRDWENCPYCGSDATTVLTVEVDEVGAAATVGCRPCGRRWSEAFLPYGRYDEDWEVIDMIEPQEVMA